MKFTNIALLFLGSVEATKLKSQSQMQAEIQSMSMNANMHQVSLREKTLLKTYLEVDMNEFLQQKMDSELFAEVDERAKSEFIGNFFHFIKCRFQDCNLVQTKAKISTKQASASPTAAESKVKEDNKNVADWASGHGNNVPAYNAQHGAYNAQGPATTGFAQVKAKSPTAAESKVKEDNKNVADWASGHGNNVPAYNAQHGAYNAQGPSTSNFAQVKTAEKKTGLAQTDSTKKERITTNTSKQVAADLEKEKAHELVVPTEKVDQSKDVAPADK